MTKRMTKAESQAIGWLIIIGIPIYGVMQLGDSFGWAPLAMFVVIIIGLAIWYQSARTAKRRAELMKKYQDSRLVEDLMNKNFWQGQTAEQLIDSLGRPEDIDQKILKTKKKEIWKYNHQGGNRYGLRITLDNDHVVGWDQKT